jgi:hypothetical protein
MDVSKEIQRGLILKILLVCYPESRTLYDVLVQLVKGQSQECDSRTLQFHIGYLHDRGYVATERLRSGPTNISLYIVRLTAKGVDLLDGRLPEDTGVLF